MAQQVPFEDEWKDMRQRFRKEGLDYESLRPDDRLLQVWRWLVDAETNLRNSRRMLDKLHEQQHEEIEEMENYVGHLRELAEKRADHLERERIELKCQSECLIKLLARFEFQGSLENQVSSLIEDRTKLAEEIEILKTLKFSCGDNGVNVDDNMLSEIIKVSSEKEVLRRQVAEMTDRVELLEKSSRQIELDNERLAFKLSEALAELEEKEAQLGEQPMLWPMHHSESSRASGKDSLRRDQVKLSHERSDCEIREASSRENLVEIAHHKELSHSYGADSTPPSLLVSELASFGSPRKLSSLMDSCNELARLEEVKKLQSESENYKMQLTVLGEKYNALALRHIQYKAKRKFQVEELRGRLDAGQCQVETLQAQLSVQRQRLRAEEMFRRQVEGDYRRLQDEKRTIAARLLTAENQQREDARELAIVQKKVALLDSANSELLAKLLRLKYKEALPKSTTCDNMLTHIGAI
ncbi:myosin-7B isoform X1 [Nilaparvata lugens]|uniref:myosin-7B isoform X1 n=1 Tax=Nilaparvata lugens TaxID=108931 RepID=UPI00193D9B2E|nr:myosin-7B isoform X1 [Nilaparvata lugens]